MKVARDILLLLSALMFPQLGQAESADKCAELVRECFSYEGVERSTCFHASAKHSFCVSGALGNLARLRWEMSPIQHQGLEDASALSGPRVLDSECIKQFDTQLSSSMLSAAITEKQIQRLTAVLKGCESSLADSVIRP